MNIIQAVQLMINWRTAFFMFLAFLLINLLRERKTFSSNNMGKVRLIQIGAIVISFIILMILLIIFRAKIFFITQKFFGIIRISRYHIELVLFSVISFELLYDFALTKNKITFDNIYPYIILYGFPILMDVITIQMDLGFISFIAGIFYIYYLYEFITNKTNTILM